MGTSSSTKRVDCRTCCNERPEYSFDDIFYPPLPPLPPPPPPPLPRLALPPPPPPPPPLPPPPVFYDDTYVRDGCGKTCCGQEVCYTNYGGFGKYGSCSRGCKYKHYKNGYKLECRYRDYC